MKKKRILLIDDEADFTSLVKLNLEETGEYEVREENRPEHALTAARAFKPDLILLDVLMPNVDGGAVAAQLKADRTLQDTPLVFLTALVSRGEAYARGNVAGGHPFVAKPVSPKELLAFIEQYLPRINGGT